MVVSPGCELANSTLSLSLSLLCDGRQGGKQTSIDTETRKQQLLELGSFEIGLKDGPRHDLPAVSSVSLAAHRHRAYPTYHLAI